jgi:hypothetical protein
VIFAVRWTEWGTKSIAIQPGQLNAVVAIAPCGIAFALLPSSCIAQQVTGELGSASATTTLSGRQLPPPDPEFGGVIEEKASESKPWWPPRVVPPKGAPNVLLIMTDDSASARRAGLAASSRRLRWIVSHVHARARRA